MNHDTSAFEGWVERVSDREWTWYVKYISANDTYAKPNVHQGGPYLGKGILRSAFPRLTARADYDRNPDLRLSARIASHLMEQQDIRLIWYNSRRIERRSSGRDEARLTNWGGKGHPLVEENATGSLVMFAFHQPRGEADADACEIWICRNSEEENAAVALVGAVDPGTGVVFSPSKFQTAEDDERHSPCELDDDEMKPEWHYELPSGEAILQMVLLRRPGTVTLPVDDRLIKRRDCEFDLFRSIESHVVLPRVREGFRTVEEFVAFANTVTNRRKSRAGKSLELQAKQIFDEERVQYSWGKATEDKRTPDFVFPSIEHYHDTSWPANRLRMLAAKTTCKDRWRQVLNEAARIGEKHLLTLQEGVSIPQFREMQTEGVILVVPRVLQAKYPAEIRGELLSLEEFLVDVPRV